MKVKCIHKAWVSVPDYFCIDLEARQRKTEFYIDLDCEYIVYGITIKDNFIWYYVCDNTFLEYPLWKPSPFFEVVDPRLSRYWIYSYKKVKNYILCPIMTFPEWANNHPDFYDKLTDCEKSELAIFARYKELMDLEFEDPNITEIAQKEEDWLICRSCFEAWEFHNTQDALVRCPQCKKILINPNYKS